MVNTHHAEENVDYHPPHPRCCPDVFLPTTDIVVKNYSTVDPGDLVVVVVVDSCYSDVVGCEVDTVVTSPRHPQTSLPIDAQRDAQLHMFCVVGLVVVVCVVVVVGVGVVVSFSSSASASVSFVAVAVADSCCCCCCSLLFQLLLHLQLYLLRLLLSLILVRIHLFLHLFLVGGESYVQTHEHINQNDPRRRVFLIGTDE
mmetsp:Transcript_46939/g.52521  ORF Transcript_46939/g.52521 Transcript_46939/m.52521 type:complete len:200 (+) Transcript_46939:314-913(+)